MIEAQRDAWFGQRIDIHTHLPGVLSGPDPGLVQRTLRLARHHGIERLVMLASMTGLTESRDPSPDHVARINDYTLAVIARYPHAYIGFCYLNPANPPSFTEDEIDRCIVRGGMRGIKLWVAVKATDSRLDPIMSRAQSLSVPVLHHAWYKHTEYVYNESTPAEIAHLAARFPGVTIVMAHLSGGAERGVLDIAGSPNVLVDTSGSQPEAGLVEYAVRQLGPHRVLFGSDHSGRDFGVQVGRILGARIGEEAKGLLFRGNALRILGLGEEDR